LGLSPLGVATSDARGGPYAIAEEAVGQRHEDPPPYAVKKQPDISQEEMGPAATQPAGPRASIPERTAEAVGERAGDAILTLAAVLGAVRQVAQLVSHQFDEQSLMMVAAGFALGYMTALLLHRRR
jgi:hypothetical protein